METNGVLPAVGERERSGARSDPEVSAQATAAFHGGVQAFDSGEGGCLRYAGRGRRAAAARGVVQFAPVVVAQGGAGGFAVSVNGNRKWHISGN